MRVLPRRFRIAAIHRAPTLTNDYQQHKIAYLKLTFACPNAVAFFGFRVRLRVDAVLFTES